MELNYYLSRSAIRTGQRCALARWFENDFFGRGIKRIPVYIPLGTGQYTHKGIEHMLKVALEAKAGPDWRVPEEEIDKAVEISIGAYRSVIEKRGFVDTLQDNLEFTLAEQTALTEALVRGFAIQTFPNLITNFEVVAVEREELISDFARIEFFLPEVSPEHIFVNLIMQSRVDGVLRQRDTQDLYLLSLKTTGQIKGMGEIDERQEKATRHDTQGIVETLAVENRLEQEAKHVSALISALKGFGDTPLPEWAHKGVTSLDKFLDRHMLNKQQVMGVIPVFMLKGKRYNNDWAGRKENYSPLIRAWKNTDVSVGPAADSFAWSYKWKGGDGKGHTLGKGWKVAYMWEQPGGVKAWIEKLAQVQETSNGIREPVVQSEAGFCLPKQFYIPGVPLLRNGEQIERWRRQTIAFETERLKKLLLVNKALPSVTIPIVTPELLKVLDENFPQSDACHYPSDCSYIPICWDGVDRPLEGGYWWRVPHHEAELQAHIATYGPMEEPPEQQVVPATEEWEEEE